MLEIKSKKFLWNKSEIWFSEAFFNKPQCDFLVFKQCRSEEVDRKFTGSKQEFSTLHVDLTMSKEKIWQEFSKTCKRFIHKGEEFGLDVEINKPNNNFFSLLNEFIGDKKHTSKITLQKYQQYIPYGDVFTVTENNNILCGHFYLRDKDRCRLFWSASKRMQKGLEKKVGLINRWLHWQAIQYYKEKGLKIYDFGGVNFDKKSGAYGITQFKLSFGGAIVKEYHFSLINSVPLKTANILGLLS